MNQRERYELDRHITGNWGEDQFKDWNPGCIYYDKQKDDCLSHWDEGKELDTCDNSCPHYTEKEKR